MRLRVGVLVAVTSVACAGASADARLKAYFDLPANTPADTLALRDAILQRVPRGTREAALDSLLAENGVGADGLSSYQPAVSGDAAVLRVEYDQRAWNIVAESYAVRIAFDRRGELQDVRVVRWLTGP